jgi:hypothetical protein
MYSIKNNYKRIFNFFGGGYNMYSPEFRNKIRDSWWLGCCGKGYIMYNDPGHAWLEVLRRELTSSPP